MGGTRRPSFLAGAALGAALAVSPAALAQPAGGGPPGARDPKAMAERQLEELKPLLKLTAEQEPKVKAVLEQNATKMREVRDKHGWTPGQPPSEEARKAMDEARKQGKDALAKVLTPEQLAEYEKWQETRRRRRP
jgi:Spy/CpxP family protein refolding chaperone